MGTIHERVRELRSFIDEGRILEAMDEFYADPVSMRENSDPPTEGLAANIERERRFLAGVKQWHGTRWHAQAVNESQGVSFLEYAFEFTNQEGDTVTYEQAAVQRWEGGRIVSERFYHG